MSEIISKSLLKSINYIGDMENTIGKIDAAIFVRTNEKIVNDKVAYLYNIITAECNLYFQKSDEHYKKINEVITNYKTKLNNLYDELYCQYVNIQNELQDARLNKKIALINYQKIINDKEKVVSSEEYQQYIDKKKELIYKLQSLNNKEKYNELYNEIELLESPVRNDNSKKEDIKAKNKMYDTIIEKCITALEDCRNSFKEKVDSLLVIPTDIDVINENSFLQKLKRRIMSLFNGKNKFEQILENYNKKILNINDEAIINEMRNETIEFVTDLLEIRTFTDSEFDKKIS